ncbi:type III secretion system chaperone [Ottowia thiooxydans]|uniref:type III secretion system chaperone n=1 Tax=Ottowia thiooxydans TaxID=219182 RepID=UPI00041674DB|nr:type III secretion system chaperone [Ottowia thiooxydans]
MSLYTEVLEDYARHAGLSAKELLSSHEVVIADISIGISPEIDQNTGDLIFFSTLGRPSAQVKHEKLMQLMLEANGLWVGTGGCTLGLQAGTGVVLLCARLPLTTINGASLSQALQAFTNVALLWREVVRGKVSAELPQTIN